MDKINLEQFLHILLKPQRFWELFPQKVVLFYAGNRIGRIIIQNFKPGMKKYGSTFKKIFRSFESSPFRSTGKLPFPYKEKRGMSIMGTQEQSLT